MASKTPEAHSCVVDLSQNQLVGASLPPLLGGLRSCGIALTKLMLHKNGIRDSAAAAIAKHLRQQDSDNPVLELHLSNNQITRKGAQLLLAAAHECRCYPVPEARKKGRRGLWLRLE